MSKWGNDNKIYGYPNCEYFFDNVFHGYHLNTLITTIQAKTKINIGIQFSSDGSAVIKNTPI